MKEIEQMPEWMEKYVPQLIEQWCGVSYDDLVTKDDLINYRNSLSSHSYGFPSQHMFDLNLSIKIQLLKILKNDNLLK